MPIRTHYDKLLEDKDYGTACRFLVRHPDIMHSMTISDVAEHYAMFSHNITSDDLTGLAEIIIKEISGRTDVKVTFG